MGSSARGVARHPTARGTAFAALALATLGCAGRATPAAPAAPAAEPARGALVVELVFGAEADLDLYVSDPAQETAYFANTPVRSGGTHLRDLRCDAPAPRVEAVRWQAPPPGRYRVGVDFPERCSDGVARARYLVRITGPDGVRELAGEVDFGRFDARAFDFEVGQ